MCPQSKNSLSFTTFTQFQAKNPTSLFHLQHQLPLSLIAYIKTKGRHFQLQNATMLSKTAIKKKSLSTSHAKQRLNEIEPQKRNRKMNHCVIGKQPHRKKNYPDAEKTKYEGRST